MSRAISALGDSALLLPLSLVVLGLLLWRDRRSALAWAVGIAATGAATVALKLAFHACGRTITDFDVVSPSGHASFAAVFYGALAVLLGRGRPPIARLGMAAAAAVLVMAIGASRVRTGAHSVEEVAIGVAVGAGGLAVFVTLEPGERGRPLPLAPVAALFAGALVLLGGQHLSLETTIGRAARQIAAALDVCGPTERRGSE